MTPTTEPTETDKCTPENWIENFVTGGPSASDKVETASAACKCTILIGPPKATEIYSVNWLMAYGVAGMYRGEPL